MSWETTYRTPMAEQGQCVLCLTDGTCFTFSDNEGYGRERLCRDCLKGGLSVIADSALDKDDIVNRLLGWVVESSKGLPLANDLEEAAEAIQDTRRSRRLITDAHDRLETQLLEARSALKQIAGRRPASPEACFARDALRKMEAVPYDD